jgi:MFS family permease
MTSPAAPLRHSHTPGSISAAFSYREFRIMWLGTAASNIGTWMQNVALPAYIQGRTGSGALVGAMVFAQLGPLLLLSIPGGVLANRIPRRTFIVAAQSGQLIGSLVLAALVASDASIVAVFFANLFIGSCNALSAPAFQSVSPQLVDRPDIPGVISLNSMQLNGSRVLGPVLAGLLGLWGVSVAGIFVVNAVTYLFVIASVMVVTLPPLPPPSGEEGWRVLTGGIRIARGKPVLARLLATMALWSFFSLPFVGLFPTVVELNFDIDASSSQYKWLYAVWGFGALLGASVTGSVLARVDKRRVIPPGFASFGLALAVFALVNSATLAFPVGFIVGFCYFMTATSMITVFQQFVSNAERSLVMSLWFMSFGGTVPIGNLVFGPVIDRFGARGVLLGGAAFSVFLAYWCDLRRPKFANFQPEA